MKNKAIEDAGKRSWVFALRVFESEEFKKDAINFRDKFNVPKEGFKNYSEAGPWFIELYFDTVDAVPKEKSSDLRTMEQRFRQHGEIHLDDSNKFENDRKLRLLDAWFSLEDIRHRYAIPPRWSKGVLTVLLTNSTEKVYLPAGVAVGKKYNGLFYNEELEVIVDRFTSKKDFEEAWKVVKQMQKSLWGGETKVKASKSYEKYKKAADLRNIDGWKDRDIANELGISPSEVSIYIDRYYKRIGFNSKRTRFL